jgi:acyl-CoA synthetase (AMP-forming)/AMP-acid ligase II/acyl carrier protein
VTDAPERPSTLPELLGHAAATSPDTVAMLAPGRPGLTYRALADQVARVQAALNGCGLGREDRVALVLPSSAEMAITFLGTACTAACAPLNPDYRAEELEFYLSDLRARAVVVQAGRDTAARAVARSLGIEVLELAVSVSEVAFELLGRNGRAAASRPAEPGDAALLLHTSGTTSRPKLVPLLHRNLCTSADNVARTLRLSPEDRCLNVMPLFHIHGLVGALLASLSAGAGFVCTGGFEPTRFFTCLRELCPTWYTAVPTIHQAVLEHAVPERIAGHRLRFIRSSSAPMPPAVMAELEARFGVPLIEAYGMTEAAHQMASNPLPPRQRKTGSVGIAAGPEIAVADADGTLLSAGRTGEIVIRGANVTPGYEGSDTANRASFTEGWFRTGDQGYLDDEGYLFLTGRLKELINRGGEKVIPREIDEILLEHPAVAQAVAFAVPHPTLGEDVAAAVVLREGARSEPQALRAFLFDRLTPVKIPSRVVIVPAIPKGPTGKVQRIGLAERLREHLQESRIMPRTPIEQMVAEIFAEVLQRDACGVDDNFFALGGDSVRAVQVTNRVYAAFGLELHTGGVFEHPTVAELAARITEELSVADGAG